MQQAFDAMTPRQVDPPPTAVAPVDTARRTEILETAASLIASSGMRTSLKEIADACGILPGSLYHHFDSKEAILVELIEQYRADLDGLAEQVHDRLHHRRRLPHRRTGRRARQGDGRLRTPAPGRAAAHVLRATVGRGRGDGARCASASRPPSRRATLEVFRAGRDARLHPRGHRPRDARRSLLPGHAPHQPRRDRRPAGRRPGAGDPVPHPLRRHRRPPARATSGSIVRPR